MDHYELERARQTVADAEFEGFVFGDSEPEGADGWERLVPGDEWTRTVWFPPIDGEGATVKGHFTVVFEPQSLAVCSAWASVDGNDVGMRPAPTAMAMPGM